MTLTIDVPASEWMTSNQRLHWAARAKRTKAVRSRTALLARSQQLTVPTPTTVAVQVHYPRNGTADPSNAAPTVKAALDGITDSGAWPDDNSEHVVEVSYRRGPKTGVKGMYRLTLTFTHNHVPREEDDYGS